MDAVRRFAVVALSLTLAACATPPGDGGQPAPVPVPSPVASIAATDAPSAAEAVRSDAVRSPEAGSDRPSPEAPEGGGRAAPVPRSVIDQGMASWYGRQFHGRRTASGERYDMHALTAAHRTLPFGTRVRVRSVHSGREVVVRINDRGPFHRSRIIDLSPAAFRALGVPGRGVTQVELLPE